MAKVTPVTDGNGAVAFVGVGKKTADARTIRQRFEGLGISTDWRRFGKIASGARSTSDPGGHRTHDLRIKSPLLCQLSYRVRRPQTSLRRGALTTLAPSRPPL